MKFEQDRFASHLGRGAFGDVFRGTMDLPDHTGRIHQSPVRIIVTVLIPTHFNKMKQNPSQVAIKVLKCAPYDRLKIEEVSAMYCTSSIEFR